VASVDYPFSIPYRISIPHRTIPNIGGVQPAAAVTLYNGDLATDAVAILDSGCVFTIFSPEQAMLIGIEDVTTGSRERINTLAGGRAVYLFDLEIERRAAGTRFAGQVGFFDAHVPRNILDRSVVFAAFEIGFHERAQVIHLRPEA